MLLISNTSRNMITAPLQGIEPPPQIAPPVAAAVAIADALDTVDPPVPVAPQVPPPPMPQAMELDVDDRQVTEYPEYILGQRVQLDTRWDESHRAVLRQGLRIKCNSPLHPGCALYRNVRTDSVPRPTVWAPHRLILNRLLWCFAVCSNNNMLHFECLFEVFGV